LAIRQLMIFGSAVCRPKPANPIAKPMWAWPFNPWAHAATGGV